MRGKLHDAFILLVGDDGVLLLPPGKRARHVSFFAYAHDDEETAIIVKEIARVQRPSVVILADTQAQHIRQDALPDVGFFDRRKIAQRRLEQAFPETDFRAVLTKGRNALFCCVENGGAVQSWHDKIAAIPGAAVSLCSLPLESAHLIAGLAPPAQRGWALLLCVHKTCGTRQVVTLNGVPIFTRVTPAVARSSSTGFIAAAFALDIRATRDYLARFGLAKETPLTLVAIVPPDVQEPLSVTPLDVAERFIFTPHRAALALRLSYAPAESEELAEIVHALALSQAGRPSAFLHKHRNSAEANARTARRMAWWGIAVLFTAAFLRLAFALPHSLSMNAQTREIQNRTSILEQDLQKARAALAHETKPLAQLRKAAERQRLFMNRDRDLFDILYALADKTRDLGTVTRIDWSFDTLTLAIKPLPLADEEMQREQLARLRQVLPEDEISLIGPQISQRSDMPLTNKPDSTPQTQADLRLIVKKGARR